MLTSLASLARALGGDVVGNQVLAPGPGHSNADRSMSVRLSPSAPDGFVVHCFANSDDLFAAKDYVRAKLGLPEFGRDRRHRRRDEQPVVREVGDAGRDDDDARRVANARRLWDDARDPRGTIVETYLTSRKLDLPDEVAGEAIRFHPACPWRDEASGRTIYVPAMIAVMRSIANEEITAVHRTRLTAEGQKVDRRMLGKASGAAIMLTPFSAIGAGLALAEGIETALSAYALDWRSVWAMGSVGAIASFPIITGLQSLVLCAETDDSGASMKAIDTVGSRYSDAGREVLLITPTMPGDLNDVIKRSAA